MADAAVHDDDAHEAPADTYAFAAHFKAVAEGVVGATLSDEEYQRMLIRFGVERLVQDILDPVENTPLWDAMLGLLERHPDTIADLMLDAMSEWMEQEEAEKRDVIDRWHRYIG